MSQKVFAAVQSGEKQTKVKTFDLPKVADDAGLLRVEVSGVCGSDWPDYKKYIGDRILGHEVVGYIEKIGRFAEQRWGLKKGDRVALEEYLPCGHCNRCRSGEFRLCAATDKWNGGIRFGFTTISEAPSLWGGYSQYLYLHPNSVFHKVPEHIPANQAALALPLGNGIEWAVNEGGAGPGKTVLIQGPGQQGLSCVLAAKQAGADCIIISGLSADEERFKLAKKFGADFTIDVQKEDIFKRVKEITGGEMADLIIDVASGGPATVTAAIDLVKIRGTIILAGKKHQEIPEFYSDKLISKYITMKGVRGHSYQAVERAIQLIASGKYPLNEMCTHHFGLNEVDKALKTVGGEGEDGAIHVTVNPWN
ncbi:zinc-dependent alcohol dehydrogenase [Halalkalibacterium ligniniphilum]|uniref:zinc-dependent alcohol dehydrogenase n=1 Tax=Halalkalibacterium ligniniphilum TaxID=1134413 RepID=UPI00034922AD|nr:zinc-binding dehydrogenase [Halalkalibacterium ligniniphilum]